MKLILDIQNQYPQSKTVYNVLCRDPLYRPKNNMNKHLSMYSVCDKAFLQVICSDTLCCTVTYTERR